MSWSKDGSTALPDGATAREDGSLRIEGRSSNIGGRYSLDVTNAYGRSSSPIDIRWKETCKYSFKHLRTSLNSHYFSYLAGQYGGYGK